MSRIYQEIMLSDPVEDEPRFRAIIDAAITAKEVEAHKKYTQETQRSKNARVKAARTEELEARELAREMGVDENFVGGGKGKKSNGTSTDGGVSDALQALILKRSKERAGGQDDFLARLEAKYAPKKTKTKMKGKKDAAAAAKAPKKRKRNEKADEDEVDAEAEQEVVDVEMHEPPEEAFRAMSERVARGAKKRAAPLRGRKPNRKDEYEVDEEAEREVVEGELREPPEEAFHAMAERAGKRPRRDTAAGEDGLRKKSRRVAVQAA
jgi:DnaJ family protein C protein 9